MLKRSVFFGLFLGLTSCASTPSKEVMADPYPTDAAAKAKALVYHVMKDPYSIRDLRIGSPHRAINNFLYPNAWTVCVSVSAKNSFGAYNRGNYLVFFKSNQAVDIQGGVGVQLYTNCGVMRAV